MSATRDLSAEARSAKVDRLDAAIDHVAARLVAVPDDGEMTLRIVSALPERTSRLRWLIPQFAAIGALAIAALVWTTRNSTAPAVTTLPSSAVASITGFANGVVADEPGTVLRTMPLERLELLGRMEPTVPEASGDHERALPAIEALGVLAVAEAETTEIAWPASIGPASIDIADLKLTAESFTTQKEE